MEKNEMIKMLENYQSKHNEYSKCLCPRCGKQELDVPLVMNALTSRLEAPIYICYDCGTAEALNDFFGVPDTIDTWFMFRGVIE